MAIIQLHCKPIETPAPGQATWDPDRLPLLRVAERKPAPTMNCMAVKDRLLLEFSRADNAIELNTETVNYRATGR